MYIIMIKILICKKKLKENWYNYTYIVSISSHKAVGVDMLLYDHISTRDTHARCKPSSHTRVFSR